MKQGLCILNKRTAIIIFLLSLILRIFLFYQVWPNLRHGSATEYGSAAIGLFENGTLSNNVDEMNKIGKSVNNSGNYLEFYNSENTRKHFVRFLPGPSILLNYLWKIVPIYNFAPYIWFQIILESILILLFYLVFKARGRYIFLLTTIFMIFNLPAINKTLMMGYDFWPQFAVLITFIGVYYALVKNKSYLFFITGLLAGITVWFRSITSFLPFFMVLFIIIYQNFSEKRRSFTILKNASFYILPIILLIFSLSIFRYNQTGNPRPTRSAFWHSFFCGVGQFSNPYDIKSKDNEVWELGKKLNSDLEKSSLGIQYNLPNSPYEITLKKEAFNFIKKYPHLFIRNTFYRIGIMISPFLYRGGDFIPISLFNLLLPIGIIAFILWFLGMYYLFKNQNLIFWLSATIYFYFFAAFGWFYVVGRVILPFLFINILVYLFGIKLIITKFKEERPNAPTHSKS